MRRAGHTEEASSTPRPVSGEATLVPRPAIITWESEIRAIAADALRWTTETGGDLFGSWANSAVVYLASLAGPAAVREAAHFRLDIAYLRELSQQLTSDWGVRYLGDWHSHHRLGLRAPSSRDKRRIGRVAARNAFPAMAEIVVTLEDRVGDTHVYFHPWVYRGEDKTKPSPASLEILSGASPVREVLIARGLLPEQELHRWVDVSAERIVEGVVRRDAGPDEHADLYDGIVGRLLDDVARALEGACGKPVERQKAAFGTVLAAPLDDTRLVGFAVSRDWPCPILEIDSIDRGQQTAAPIALPLPPSLHVPGEVVTRYREAAQRISESRIHVDPDTD